MNLLAGFSFIQDLLFKHTLANPPRVTVVVGVVRELEASLSPLSLSAGVARASSYITERLCN